ncbi:hypothetical protein BDQ17DRAFT_1348369 [Cyathus striatus]|nr:hypothetical protein BDQ17DRAFT_1348369 [Cyathus striatus]
MQSTFKFSLIFLLASFLSVTALKLNVPVPGPGSTQLETDGNAIVSWTVEEGDPEFISIEIQNDISLDSFEFARNVPTAPGNVSGILDEVPGGDTFYLQAVSVKSVLDVYATSDLFTVVGEVPPITNTGYLAARETEK